VRVLIPGVDVFLSEGIWREYLGKRIAIMSNTSGATSNLTYSVEELLSRGLNVEGVLAPEHGFWGIYHAGEPVPHMYDQYLGLNIYSLYRSSMDLALELLEQCDVVIVDIQDLGLRFYTYISTLIDLLDIASKMGGKEVVILDRPNPLGGDIIEGPVARPELYSYVARYSIPLRHGATIGEIALLYNYEKNLGIYVRVIKNRGWRRNLDIIDFNIPWIPPSPAIPSPWSVYTYGVTAYLEGTNISEGRGTYNPFTLFGAPFIEPRRLCERLNREKSLEGLFLRPVYFKPMFSKYQGQVCGGAYIHIIDRRRVRILNVGLKILSTIHELYGESLELMRVGERYYIDQLIGDPRGRMVITGDLDLDDFSQAIEDGIRDYRERISHVMLYR